MKEIIDNDYKIYTKNEDEFESKIEEYKIIVSSYMSKEDFISFINSLDFKCVKCCDFELMLGFIINCKDMSFKQLSKKVVIK